MTSHRSIVVCMGLLLGACTDRPAFEQGGGTLGGSGEPDEGTTIVAPPPPGLDDGTTAIPTSPDGTDTSPTDDPSFVPVPDGGGGQGESCTMEEQDCAPGLKCMPYDSQRTGSWWDETACFPVHPDPVGLYEPCEYEGQAWSGHDNCGWAQVCWDHGDGVSTCQGACVMGMRGDWDTLLCEDPMAIPYTGCQQCFCMCEVSCDPLLQDCGEGQGCYHVSDLFLCVPDASGDAGAAGDPCQFINACDPGLMCAGAAAVFGCVDIAGCCTPMCDIDAPNACPGAAEGEQCVSLFEAPEEAPPGLAHVGACMLPQ